MQRLEEVSRTRNTLQPWRRRPGSRGLGGVRWGGGCRGWGAEGLANQHFNYMKAIVFYLECELMKLISLCGMNPLACQIIARGSDSASQFLSPLLQRRAARGGEEDGGEEEKKHRRQQQQQTGCYRCGRQEFTSTSGPELTLSCSLREPPSSVCSCKSHARPRLNCGRGCF